jgi:nucleoside 2-deoxyribosyltransferase
MSNKIRVYLAGPMRGLPEFNFPAFDAAAAQLRDAGLEVFSPAEKGLEKHAEANQESLAFRRAVFLLDTEWICRNADVIALLPGWEKSKGAVAERALAEAIGIPVRLFNPETGVLADV